MGEGNSRIIMKNIKIISYALTIALLCGCAGISVEENSDKITNKEELEAALDEAWEKYVTEESQNETRLSEIDNRAMDYGDVTMKYGIQVKGEPDENGYPVFIALHGGGGSDTPDINDQQWAAMATYYGTSVKNGIYVNPRGVRDTWNCHFNDESYILYDELIENLILFYNADPNRVYIMGYSAGGDGVYGITPRMPDRFAAANMSAGHPNGLDLTNIFNVPIALQVGINDSDYDRNTVTAQYGMYLDELAADFGEDYYKHVTWVHTGYAHNFIDYKNSEQEVIDDYALWLETGEVTTTKVDTNAVHFVEQYTRNPYPEQIVWDLSNRAPLRDNNCYYWLRADSSIQEGNIRGSYSKESNTISFETIDISEDADFDILISPEMVDVFSEITFILPEGEVKITLDNISKDTIWESTIERGDKNYQYVAVVSYRELISQ